jgi:hypothetical protein
VYVADVRKRAVGRLSAPAAPGWTVREVLAEAKRRASGGSVLSTFDVPLGIPASLRDALGRSCDESLANFLKFLPTACSIPRFFEASPTAEVWRPDRPFFAVPPRESGLQRYLDAARTYGVDLYRQIDRLVGAKSAFVTSGIPGSVGSSVCDLWRELALCLTHDRAFKIWPFEGDLGMLLKSSKSVVGEIYPRAAYATALCDEPIEERPCLSVAKTDCGVRREAIAVLRAARWVRSLRVSFKGLTQAEANEDDFDACITAAALLRCVLERVPLCSSQCRCSVIEGGILGTGSVNLCVPRKTFRRAGRQRQVVGKRERYVKSRAATTVTPHGRRQRERETYSCPIAGCNRIFQGSRGGWDAHVGSLRLHQEWHPELQERRKRRQQFKIEFPDFFR